MNGNTLSHNGVCPSLVLFNKDFSHYLSHSELLTLIPLPEGDDFLPGFIPTVQNGSNLTVQFCLLKQLGHQNLPPYLCCFLFLRRKSCWAYKALSKYNP